MLNDTKPLRPIPKRGQNFGLVGKPEGRGRGQCYEADAKILT